MCITSVRLNAKNVHSYFYGSVEHKPNALAMIKVMAKIVFIAPKLELALIKCQ